MQSAANPFSSTMAWTEILKVKAIARQVSLGCTMYESGVGVGSGVSVAVGARSVGVVEGMAVRVGVSVSSGSAMLPVRLSAR